MNSDDLKESPPRQSGEEWSIVPPRNESRAAESNKSHNFHPTTTTQNSLLEWLHAMEEQDPPKNKRNDGDSQEPPFLLLLVGLPGSGKSTIAQTLCRVRPWQFERINQDELGSRLVCEKRAMQTLLQGKCPIIDRCNISFQQRKYWTKLAATATAKAVSCSNNNSTIHVDCLTLDIPAETCQQRCEARKDHPTVKPHAAKGVIQSMMREWQPPSIQEGFRSISIAKDNAALQQTIKLLLRCRK